MLKTLEDLKEMEYTHNSDPFVFKCLEGAVKRTTISTALRNKGISSLNLHPTLDIWTTQ